MSEQVKIETPAELREAIGIDQLRERIEELRQENERLRWLLFMIGTEGFPDEWLEAEGYRLDFENETVVAIEEQEVQDE